MAFFDKIGEFAKNVGDKTGGMIETTKLKTRIKTENDSILGLQQQIGAICLNKSTEGTVFDEDIERLLEEIKACLGRIAKLQEEIEAINKANQTENGITCAACGSVNPPDTKFCSSCGTKIEPPAPAEVPGGVICPSCGKPNSPDTKFCVHCGTNLENAGPKLCPSCGTKLEVSAKFCGTCGQKIE